MTTQFPPSSPTHFLEDKHDPFSVASPDGKLHFHTRNLHYATPQPSSTLGRSSSPSRHHDSEDEFEREIVAHMAATENAVYIKPRGIPIKLTSGRPVVLGRSKTRCNYPLPNHARMSRVHAIIDYKSETDKVLLNCKGLNGVIVTFPRCMNVKFIKENDIYKLVPGKSEINDKIISNEELTSFVVLKDEIVQFPYVHGTMVDFRNDVMTYLELADETSTESEQEEVALFESKEIQEKPQEEQAVIAETPKVLEDTQATKFIPIALPPVKVAPANVSPVSSPVRMPSRAVSPIEDLLRSDSDSEREADSTQSPTAAGTIKIHTQSTETLPTVTDTIKIHTQSTESLPPVASSPIAPKELELPVAATTIEPEVEETTPATEPKNTPLRIISNNVERRRKLNTPSPKRTHKKPVVQRKYRDPKDKIESMNVKEVLSTISDIEHLQDVLANHLAFSRLNQTPISAMQEVNSTTKELTRKQLRALLATKNCIGVIYRTGKDAAGKPLDEEYYYDVEKDDDDNRKQMVSSIKGRVGLRSCRKTHKQYFWKKPAK